MPALSATCVLRMKPRPSFQGKKLHLVPELSPMRTPHLALSVAGRAVAGDSSAAEVPWNGSADRVRQAKAKGASPHAAAKVKTLLSRTKSHLRNAFGPRQFHSGHHHCSRTAISQCNDFFPSFPPPSLIAAFARPCDRQALAASSPEPTIRLSLLTEDS